MNILVIGGSGLIGSKLSARLRKLGHSVNAASPATGVNTITGEGLDAALDGIDVVVDVSNSPSFEDKAVMEFFETSSRNLLAAEKKAGTKHHVALSVVGTERLQDSGYFRAKQAQENLIQQSGVPYSIVHSTQFFEFLGSIAASGSTGEAIHLSPAPIQPIASDDVAASMAEIATGAPVNGVVEIAGPEQFRLAELVQEYLTLTNDARTVTADVHAPYFGAELNERSLVPESAAHTGATDFHKWFGSREIRN
jgi:uncharacterized protein YbjT (DUF2867 family)